MIELSKLIEEINNRNNPLRDLPILGVNSSKKFMPSIANVIGADLSKYKLVKKGEFATNLMHVDRDETVPVSLLSNDACIVSPAYNVFKVKNTEICRAEYLNIVFKSKQFDRQAWFKSGSSIRGNLDWNKFLTLNINLPSIDKQCKLIAQYNTIEAKINILSKLNDNLYEILDLQFAKYINDTGNCEDKFLIDFLNFDKGTEPGSENYLENKSINTIPFIRVQNINSNITPKYVSKKTEKIKLFNENDILVSFDGTIGKIGFGINGCYSSGLQRVTSKLNFISCGTIVAIMHSNIIQNELSKSQGTTINHASKKIPELKIPFSADKLKEFSPVFDNIFQKLKTNTILLARLQELLSQIINSTFD